MVSCINCDEDSVRSTHQKREVSRLTKFYNAAKERLSLEETLVNQLTETRKKSSQSIMALETRNTALSVRIRAAEQVLPKISKHTRALRRNLNQKDKPFLQMKKGELMEHIKTLNRSTMRSVWTLASVQN